MVTAFDESAGRKASLVRHPRRYCDRDRHRPTSDRNGVRRTRAGPRTGDRIRLSVARGRSRRRSVGAVLIGANSPNSALRMTVGGLSGEEPSVNAALASFRCDVFPALGHLGHLGRDPDDVQGRPLAPLRRTTAGMDLSREPTQATLNVSRRRFVRHPGLQRRQGKRWRHPQVQDRRADESA